MKKVLALVLAAMMALALCGTAFAVATGDPTISVSGLDVGDYVNLYQVLEWTEGTGWTLTSDFATLNNAGINAIIANTVGATLSKSDVEAITTFVKNNNIVARNGGSATTATYTETVNLGLYLALVTPAVPGTLYNPMIVSADFNTENTSSTISSSEKLGTVAKKQPVTVEKTEPKITNDIGETYEFTIVTTIPTYAESFVNTYFKVSDAMSPYLDYVENSIKVNGSDVPAHCTFVLVDSQHFTLTFDDDYIKALTAPQEITITYSAKLNLTAEEAAALPNVKEENNKVTVEFPNNPSDDTDKSVLKDETREYTFTIDGKLFGNEDWTTKEVVKVGLDKNNNPIESVVNYGHGNSHAALDGAEFILCKSQDESDLYTNDHFDGHVTTANHGLMNITGLDVGTYYLKEVTAPNGYIKDTDWHTVTIAATIEQETYTEYYTIDGSGNVTWYNTQVTGSKPCSYTVNVLKDYTVTVDGHATSYEMTLSGPSIYSVTPAESDAEIVNTKGLELPSTGGIGTTIFYVAGLLMVLGAGTVLVARRKADEE